MSQTVKIILPAYNEEDNIVKLLLKIEQLAQQIPYFLTEVLLVNDGSKDDTLKVVKGYTPVNFKLDIYDQQPNKGLAAAVKTGFIEGTKNLGEHDILVVLDADDSHSPLLIERMVKQVNQGSDLVIASRYQKGARIKGLTKFRQLTGWAASIVFRILAPIKGVKDYTCGFRAYKVSTLNKMQQIYGDSFIEEKGFACMAEILLKIAAEGFIIHEEAMILRYDNKIGESKMNVSNTIKRILILAFFKNREIKRRRK